MANNRIDWSKARILIVGAKGMLGSDLHARLAARIGADERRLIGFGGDALDICDAQSVNETVGGLKPDVVFNCAAHTNVDGCESEKDKAFAINGDGPGHLAKACKACGALLVHISTDFVFDGSGKQPYRVDDVANPLSVYGASKWQGECAIRESGCRHLLVRTSWLFGHHGRNFVEAILKKAEAGENLRVVNDQVGRPTNTVDLADGLLRLLESDATGTFHFANEGQCSWYEFAAEIVRVSELSVQVEPITSAELVRPAKRPAYSVLDLSAYESMTGHTPRKWQDALRQYMRERKNARAIESDSKGRMNQATTAGQANRGAIVSPRSK